MTQNRILYVVALCLAGVMIIASGCKPDPEPDPIPEDGDPRITIMNPTSGYSLDTIGAPISIQYRLDDNEFLTEFRIAERWLDPMGNEVLPETQIYSQNLSESNWVTTFNAYTVPQVQLYSRIELIAYAVDSKGKVDRAVFTINVIPVPSDAPEFLVEEYPDGDTIWTGTNTAGKFYFDFVNRTNDVTNPNRRDIGEASVSGFQKILNSPNNGPADSVIVVTNSSLFNYDQMTYQSAWEAFVTNPNQLTETPTLSVGDIVIIKSPPTTPHLVAMRIKEIEPNTFPYMVFEYKRTYE